MTNVKVSRLNLDFLRLLQEVSGKTLF